MDFRVVLAEGVFYEEKAEVLIRQGPVAPAKSVLEELTPLVGKRIRLAMHHLPPNLQALDESKWGGGCCLWQPAPCPAGHHERPGYLLNVTGDGVLRYDDKGSWHLDMLDGSKLRLPFDQMVGHFGRLAAATLLDVDKLRDTLSPDDLDQVTAMSSKLGSIKEMLERMRQDS